MEEEATYPQVNLRSPLLPERRTRQLRGQTKTVTVQSTVEAEVVVAS